MTEDTRLEAVTFHVGDHKVQIATLGGGDMSEVENRVTELIQNADPACGLLNGSCAECTEHHVSKATGGRVQVRFEGGRMIVEKETCPTAPRFWRWTSLKWPEFVQRQPPLLHPPDEGAVGHEHHHDHMEWPQLAALAGACAVFAIGAWAASMLGASGWVVVALYLCAYAAGGWDAAGESWERLREGRLDVHFLMLSVAIGAAAIGAWGEGALLLFLFSASGTMEQFAMGRTQREISALLRGAPKTATVLDDAGGEREAPVGELTPGTILRVTGGAMAPLDMEVLRGETEFDESSLTGESTPVRKVAGDEVLAGTLNLWGVVEGRVLRPAGESALEKMIRLIREAQHLKAPAQRFTDRFGTGYTWAVLGLCTLMFFVWWAMGAAPFAGNAENPGAFYRAMTLLVVCSPCALVLSVPSAVLSAIASAARRGVLFRGGAAVETLAGISAVALDKTGTLTEGELALETVEAADGDRDTLLQRAASLAHYSDHPVSRAVWRAAVAAGTAPLAVDNLHSVPGQGVSGVVDGMPSALGRHDFVSPLSGAAATEDSEAHDGRVVVWFGANGMIVGHLIFRDRLRADAAGLLADLKSRGLALYMLTGDSAGAAQRIATGLPLDGVLSGLLPRQKVEAVMELRGRHGRIAMIGDGVNDAASLAAADVGVAMGARGSDSALEQAEVVLLKDRLENFLVAHSLSVKSRRVIWQNIAVSLGTVVLMAGTILLHGAPLGLAVLAHEGSTVMVVLNSLRLLGAGGPSVPR